MNFGRDMSSFYWRTSTWIAVGTAGHLALLAVFA